MTYHRWGRHLAPLLIVLMLGVTVFSATLADYKTRLDSADTNLKKLIDDTREVVSGRSRDIDNENSIITAVRAGMPASEKIEWNSSTAETSNRWLHDKLDAFQVEKDAVKRLAIATEARERIGALLGKINELENPLSSDRTKDEDKQKLGEILKREEFQPPSQAEESLFQRWWRRFKEWLESIFPRANTPETSGTGFQSFGYILQILLYIVVIGAIGFLLYKFVPSLFGKFGGKVKKSKKDRVILGEHIAAEESAETLFGEAERLAREGNLRGAIRKGYIALLCELSDRKVIGLAKHKTNRDYLRDVRNRTELYQNMNGMTNSFERHWYGFQPPESSDWDEFRQRFRRAIETGIS